MANRPSPDFTELDLEKVSQFLLELSALSNRYNIAISPCEHCGEPALSAACSQIEYVWDGHLLNINFIEHNS